MVCTSLADGRCWTFFSWLQNSFTCPLSRLTKSAENRHIITPTGTDMPQVGQEIGQLHLPNSDARICLRLTALMLKSQFSFPGLIVGFFLIMRELCNFPYLKCKYSILPYSFHPKKHTHLIYYTNREGQKSHLAL